MKLLAISEHFFPRVGGTVNYVHETLCALAAQGVSAELLVPGPAPTEWQGAKSADLPYQVTWVEAGYPAQGDPSRDARYDFCNKMDALVASRLNGPDRPDILHVLFGLFVMEVLGTDRLRAAGLRSVATVHNVPPMECRQTAHNAPFKARLKEDLRLKAVSWKNRKRLRRNNYDLYVVPSQQVHGFLSPIVSNNVSVIGHGLTSDLHDLMQPPATRAPGDGVLRLLTAGGFAPHKRQHIIPETAARLRERGLRFHWDVVGPAGRTHGYFDTIERDISDRDLGAHVKAHAAVPFPDLARLYDGAHIYVQPSIEEGFCLTALDAAAAGLPVIGSAAGALPDIIAASGGRLIDSAPVPLAEAIDDFATQAHWSSAPEQMDRIQNQFSWERAASALLSQYAALGGTQ